VPAEPALPGEGHGHKDCGTELNKKRFSRRKRGGGLRKKDYYRSSDRQRGSAWGESRLLRRVSAHSLPKSKRESLLQEGARLRLAACQYAGKKEARRGQRRNKGWFSTTHKSSATPYTKKGEQKWENVVWGHPEITEKRRRAGNVCPMNKRHCRRLRQTAGGLRPPSPSEDVTYYG